MVTWPLRTLLEEVAIRKFSLKLNTVEIIKNLKENIEIKAAEI